MAGILKREKEDYRYLVENANSIILEMDSVGEVTFWNKFAAQFFGYAPGEILGQSVVGTIVPATETGGRDLRQLIEEICKDPQRFANNVNENIKKNGERVWISWTNCPIFDDNGRIEAILCIGNNITERKNLEEKLRQMRDELEIRVRVRTAELAKANEELRLDICERKRVEEAVREGERFLENIFSSIQDGISILDMDMHIMRVNQTMERWYAHVVPLVGKRCYEAYHGRQQPCEVCPTRRTLETGESGYEIVPKTGPGGENIGWLDLYSFPLKDIATGQIKGIIEYVRDITQEKETEERLAKINECFLSFGADSNENIKRITNLCGQLLGADCALYSRLNQGSLYAVGQWNMVDGYKQAANPQGQICYDIIVRGLDGAFVARHLQQSPYARTDENVRHYGLEACLGYPVKSRGRYAGSLCVAYRKDIVHSENDKRVIGILASAIGIEEERRHASEALEYRLEFEKLVMGISTNFINLPLDEIDLGINRALELISKFTGACRSYIFLFRPNGKKMDNLYEWCAPAVQPQIDRLQGVNVNDFPWFLKRIMNLEVVHIPQVSKLPVEAIAEKNEFESEKTKSLLCVPFVYAGNLLGFLGFDAVFEEKSWSEDTIALLKIVGEIFANTLGRKWARHSLEELNRELSTSNKALKQSALRDQQTGLYNHRYLSEVIEAEFHRARRYAHPLSAIMLDIDYFKSINDVYGHQFGDLVLQQFATQLKRMVRQYDIVIRFGGEEFVIISPAAERHSASILAQRILDAVSLYNFGNKKHNIKLKLSIAVASYPDDKVLKGIDLIGVAEWILNKVKESGGNRVYTSLEVVKKIRILPGNSKENTDTKFLKEKVEKLTKRANQSLIESVFAFAKTIELKDHYTGEHVERTVHYAIELARSLGLSAEEIERIRQAAILHDLGKIGISEKILLKRSKLTDRELTEIKKHPQIGVDIIRPIQFLHAIIPFILYHHERWDGKGYPSGLKGEAIPFGARIIAIADVYQALLSDRPYRKAYPKDEVVKIIKNSAGMQFDPEITNSFLKII